MSHVRYCKLGVQLLSNFGDLIGEPEVIWNLRFQIQWFGLNSPAVQQSFHIAVLSKLDLDGLIYIRGPDFSVGIFSI